EIPSERDRRIAMIAGHERRSAGLAARALGSELAVGVRSPAQRPAQVVERAAVRRSDTDRRERARFGDARRRLMCDRRTIAELPAFILAPAPRRSAAGDGTTVRQTGRDRREP